MTSGVDGNDIVYVTLSFNDNIVSGDGGIYGANDFFSTGSFGSSNYRGTDRLDTADFNFSITRGTAVLTDGNGSDDGGRENRAIQNNLAGPGRKRATDLCADR